MVIKLIENIFIVKNHSSYIQCNIYQTVKNTLCFLEKIILKKVYISNINFSRRTKTETGILVWEVRRAILGPRLRYTSETLDAKKVTN